MKKIYNLDTPKILIYKEITEKNIKNMQKKADDFSVSLMPHFKTHKSLKIANMQKKAGASGITVSGTEEAEVAIKGGFDKVLIAYPVVSDKKYEKVLNLSSYADVELIFDSPIQIKKMNDFFKKRTDKKFSYYIKVDVGLKRLGIEYNENSLKLINEFLKIDDNFEFKGILSHAGNSYACKDLECIKKVIKKEKKIMFSLKKDIEDNFKIKCSVNVGATPTLSIDNDLKGFDVIRPGNYVLYDAIGISLGICSFEDVAIRVLTRVISVKKDRIIIDAGSKILGLDKGAHSIGLRDAYGIVVGKDGKEEKNLKLTRLSEEHGILEVSGKHGFRFGDYMEIIPNHSCYCMNLVDSVFLVNKDKIVEEEIRIDARGKS